MSKKFISFLGTGNYQCCKYKLSNTFISNDVIYVQEALIKALCMEYSEADSICIFVTKEAKTKHLANLLDKLNLLDLKCKIIPIEINDSKTEADIWALFQTLYDAINDKDSVVFDLTHSFRYLPMLFFSILNYAQYLKEISVEGIYYGAYEARTEDNIAPIFDMLDAYTVLQWANAADSFVNYGIADKLYKQIKKQDMEFSDTGKLSDSILKLADNMNFSRGQRIYEGKMFSNCLEKINTYKYSDDVKLNPILLPVLDSVEKKMENFTTNSALNFIPAVQWYIDHDMPAEAISMLKEGICTYLIIKANEDYKNPSLRLVLGKRLAYKSNKHFEYAPNQKQWEKVVESIMSTKLAKKIKPCIEDFNSFRNDIDHSGFVEQARSPENLRKEIIGAFDSLKAIFTIEGIIS